MSEPTQERIKIRMSGTSTSGRVALLETVEQTGNEPPLHCHHWEDEVFYLLAGEMAIFLSGIWQLFHAGDVIVIPRGMEHTYAVLTDEAHWLTMFAPAGFELFYLEVGTQPPWAKNIAHEVERWVTVAARYGCEITGPHPGRPVF